MPMSSTMALDMSANENQGMVNPHVGAGRASDDSISMSSDMDMGSDRGDSSIAADAAMNATGGQLMSTSPQPEMMTERFVSVTQPGMETRAMHHHPGTFSSCSHETCSQVSASVSPPRVDDGQLNFLHCVLIRLSAPMNLWTSSHWIGPGTPPPENLAAESLATILRI